jgi:predicted nucleic acid-binding protein
MIVVDANVLSFYVIEGERTAEAHALREADAEWLVPAFWSVEFLSILRKYVRFKGMPLEAALNLLDHAQAMFSPNEVITPPDIALRDALRLGITVYDAQYVSLARQYGVRCVTEDGPVQKRCPEVAISLDKFLGGLRSGGVVREPRATYRTRRRPSSTCS